MRNTFCLQTGRGVGDDVVDGIGKIRHRLVAQSRHADSSVREHVDVILADNLLALLSCLDMLLWKRIRIKTNSLHNHKLYSGECIINEERASVVCRQISHKQTQEELRTC